MELEKEAKDIKSGKDQPGGKGSQNLKPSFGGISDIISKKTNLSKTRIEQAKRIIDSLYPEQRNKKFKVPGYYIGEG